MREIQIGVKRSRFRRRWPKPYRVTRSWSERNRELCGLLIMAACVLGIGVALYVLIKLGR